MKTSTGIFINLSSDPQCIANMQATQRMDLLEHLSRVASNPSKDKAAHDADVALKNIRSMQGKLPPAQPPQSQPMQQFGAVQDMFGSNNSGGFPGQPPMMQQQRQPGPPPQQQRRMPRQGLFCT